MRVLKQSWSGFSHVDSWFVIYGRTIDNVSLCWVMGECMTQALLLKRPRVWPLGGVGDNQASLKSRDQSGVRLVPSLLRNLGETLALLYDFSRRWLHPIDGKWVNNLAFVRSAVLKNPFRGNSCNEEKVPAECSWDISKINIFLLLYIAILAPP